MCFTFVGVLDLGLAVRIGLLAGAALIVGVGGTVASFAAFHAGPFSREAQTAADWRDLQSYSPDPRAAIANAIVTPGGRRAALFWVEPARPPQVATKKYEAHGLAVAVLDGSGRHSLRSDAS